jgi:hypothetical protein
VSWSIHVGFVVDKVALGQVSLRVLLFSPVSIIPPLLHIHLSPPHDVCDNSDQVAHYHHLGPKLGDFISDPALRLENKTRKLKKTCLRERDVFDKSCRDLRVYAMPYTTFT